MYLLFLLIPLHFISGVIGKDDSIRQCSVFPNANKKCFGETLDIRAGGSTQKEITYNAAETTKAINADYKAGVMRGLIIVGSAPKHSYGNFRDTYWCTKQSTPDNFDDQYGTGFEKKGVSQKSLFITTRRELWECKMGRMEFHRVVTEHLSKEPIESILFRDGTSVVKIPIPRLNADSELFITAIREIKYLNKFKENIMFGGYLSFKNEVGEDRKDNTFRELNLIPDASGTYVVTVSASQGGKRTILKQKYLNNNGIPDRLKSVDGKAFCQESDLRTDENENHRLFGVFPTWYMIENGGAEMELKGSKFLERFIVTKRNVYGCWVEKEEGVTDKVVFFMMEIEYLGKSKVDEAYLNDRRTTAYSFKLPETTDESIGIKETIYFMIEGGEKRFFNYKGKWQPGTWKTDEEAQGGKKGDAKAGGALDFLKKLFCCRS